MPLAAHGSVISLELADPRTRPLENGSHVLEPARGEEGGYTLGAGSACPGSRVKNESTPNVPVSIVSRGQEP
jgi:hypothetical protein